MRGPLTILAAAAGLAGFGAYYVYSAHDAAVSPEPLIRQYCTDCHNANDFAGELRLDDKVLEPVAEHAETWERVVRKLRTGMMPPADAPRPARTTLDALATELEQRLDASTIVAGHDRGALRRLNRTEYANAIYDLLHLRIDPAALLPLDDSSEGFDNVATSLGVSPSLVEAWISAAMKISRRALGDETAPESQIAYAAPSQLDQSSHLEGLPLGTRGGMTIEHEFPLDAEYAIRIRTGFRLPRSTSVTFMIDGTEIALDDSRRFSGPIPAGPHTLTAALVDSLRPGGVDEVYAEFSTPGGVSAIEIAGPMNPTGVGVTPSRQRILECTPKGADEELPCARTIIRSIASRAFRRPQSPESLEPLLDFYAQGRSEGDFETGIQHALARILVDPRFLYRIETAPSTLEPGDIYAVDDYDLATRLAFFLWSSIPDDRLLALADGGTLANPAVLEAEVARMLADPKASALVENFASQWLFLRELESVTPDADDFDDNLKQAMLEETGRLFASVMNDDLSVVRLIDADFTWLNDRLANHYGIDGVHGSYFRKVNLPADNPRRGLLGHASILTLTSVTSRTSPVIRGSWILENLLGSPAPVPPPNVETTLEGDDGAAVAATVRERLESHRANPTCASCHAIMDPIGFSLERFDLIGAWRDTENGLPIDTTATLVDGTHISGPAELRAALLGRTDTFVMAMTEKLMTYALGRAIEYTDMPTVRAIVSEAKHDDYRFSALIHGIVMSKPFLTQIKGAGDR